MATLKDIFGTSTAFTITLASLANSSAGVGRQSTLVDNTTNAFLNALVYLKLKMGTTPTANTPIYVYLLRSNNDDPIVDDAAGTTDAGLTVVNANPLGTIVCTAATTGALYTGVFDTAVLGELGPKWGIAIVNNTGVALDSVEGSHLKKFIGVTKSVA